jgi:hypothetical protein
MRSGYEDREGKKTQRLKVSQTGFQISIQQKNGRLRQAAV